MKNKICGIYMFTNLVNGKNYIGSSQDCRRRYSEHTSRLRRNVHINKKLQAAWNKHGESNFKFTIVFQVFYRDDLETIEQQFLDDYKAVQKGYNLSPTAGNTAGWKASEETRRKMSEAAKRRDNSLQVKAMQAATKGRKRPQYVIDAMQAGRRAKPINDESRKRMAESAKARSRYDELDRFQMVLLLQAGTKQQRIADLFGLSSYKTAVLYAKRWIGDNC